QARAAVDRCVLIGNMCENLEGWHVAATDNSTLVMTNCTITWEPIWGWTYAISCIRSSGFLVNSIIYGESPLTITFRPDSAIYHFTVANCDLASGRGSISDTTQVNWLDGNLAEDPRFVNFQSGDYHLAEGSPGIDAGTAFFAWEGDTLVNLSFQDYFGEAPDMGALESHYETAPGITEAAPYRFILHPAYPNPFNQTTTLQFELPFAQKVRLTVFDLSGRELKTLERGYLSAGSHRQVFSGEGLNSGVHWVRLEAGSRIEAVPLIILR
ncbi:MAG: T9SS type A sorting domain-containing protein, partial [Calditrichota bacterium]